MFVQDNFGEKMQAKLDAEAERIRYLDCLQEEGFSAGFIDRCKKEGWTRDDVVRYFEAMAEYCGQKNQLNAARQDVKALLRKATDEPKAVAARKLVKEVLEDA